MRPGRWERALRFAAFVTVVVVMVISASPLVPLIELAAGVFAFCLVVAWTLYAFDDWSNRR